jgi:hypothetical protein
MFKTNLNRILGVLACFATVALIAAVLNVKIGGYPPEARADVDSWSGHTENHVSWSASVTLGTPAIICTASTTVNPQLKAMVITSSASGVVILMNSATPAAANQFMTVGLLANTPLVISENQFRQGVAAGLGNPIYLNGPTGTVTVDYWYRAGTK